MQVWHDVPHLRERWAEGACCQAYGIFDFELDQSDLDAIESMEGDFDEYWDPLGVQIDDDWIGDVSRGWPMWEPDEPVQIDADEKKEL